jgi:hypothetical protein
MNVGESSGKLIVRKLMKTLPVEFSTGVTPVPLESIRNSASRFIPDVKSILK